MSLITLPLVSDPFSIFVCMHVCPCSLNRNSNSEHSLGVDCVLDTVPNLWCLCQLILRAADAFGAVVTKWWTCGRQRWRAATLPSASSLRVLSGDMLGRDRPLEGGPPPFREQKGCGKGHKSRLTNISGDDLPQVGRGVLHVVTVLKVFRGSSSTCHPGGAAKESLVWKCHLKTALQKPFRKISVVHNSLSDVVGN